MRAWIPILMTWLLAEPALAGLDAAWRALPASVAGDSVGLVLRGWELRGGPGVRPGEASFALGQFRYARGEYGAAEAAFVRASARLTGEDRLVARHAFGLAALAHGQPMAARLAFQEVARGPASLRPAALLGLAQCWEAEGRRERAFDVLRTLLSGEAGEAGPAALERFAALASLLHREREAMTARERLLRQYPRSIEAARARGSANAAARPRGVGLETGAAPSRLPAP